MTIDLKPRSFAMHLCHLRQTFPQTQVICINLAKKQFITTPSEPEWPLALQS